MGLTSHKGGPLQSCCRTSFGLFLFTLRATMVTISSVGFFSRSLLLLRRLLGGDRLVGLVNAPEVSLAAARLVRVRLQRLFQIRSPDLLLCTLLGKPELFVVK